MHNNHFKLTQYLLLILALTGCTKNNQGPVHGQIETVRSVDPNAIAGHFAETLISNLSYKTASHQGQTDSDGVFYFREGEDITFYIGGAELPPIKAKKSISVTDIATYNIKTTNRNTAQPNIDTAIVINFFSLMFSLDEDGEWRNGIQINSQTHSLMPFVSFETKPFYFFHRDEIDTLLTQLFELQMNRSTLLLSPDEVLARLTERLLAQGRTNFFNSVKISLEENNLSLSSSDGLMFFHGQKVEGTQTVNNQTQKRNYKYALDHTISKSVLSTHYGDKEKIAFETIFEHSSDKSKVTNIKQSGWKNWWENDTGEKFEEFESQYSYTGYSISSSVENKNFLQTNTSSIITREFSYRDSMQIDKITEMATNSKDNIDYVYYDNKRYMLKNIIKNGTNLIDIQYDDIGRVTQIEQFTGPQIGIYTYRYSTPTTYSITKHPDNQSKETNTIHLQDGICHPADLRFMRTLAPNDRFCLSRTEILP